MILGKILRKTSNLNKYIVINILKVDIILRRRNYIK